MGAFAYHFHLPPRELDVMDIDDFERLVHTVEAIDKANRSRRG